MSFSDLRYEGRYVSVGEFDRVHVMEFGPSPLREAKQGPPLLLIHGAGACGAVWHRQIATLSDSHRVIVPDIPMFGLSDMPSRVYAPRHQIADVILGVMDTLGVDTTDIAAHSIGALGSLGAMIQAPHRFNRAILIAPPGFGRGLNWMLRLASVPPLHRFMRYDSKRDRHFFFDRFEAQRTGPSPERELWKDMHFQIGNRNGAIPTFRQGLRTFAGLMGQRDVVPKDEVAKVTAPTLLIWGDSDRIIPTRHTARAIKTIPDARLEIIENCGHIVQLEAPNRLTELMTGWLAHPPPLFS